MAGVANGTSGAHERRLMQSESRWLQKALFALSKAEDDRVKLDEASKSSSPMTVKIKGKPVDITLVREAMSEAVQERAEDLRVALNKGQAVLR